MGLLRFRTVLDSKIARLQCCGKEQRLCAYRDLDEPPENPPFGSRAPECYKRLKRSGRVVCNPLATLSMFTIETLRTPRSIPL